MESSRVNVFHKCDWLWENAQGELSRKTYLNNSKRNISRRLKAAGLQFAT